MPLVIIAPERGMPALLQAGKYRDVPKAEATFPAHHLKDW